jgi:hypothetical protein
MGRRVAWFWLHCFAILILSIVPVAPVTDDFRTATAKLKKWECGRNTFSKGIDVN